MKTLINLLLALVFAVFLNGCKSGLVISHGSSFGHCRGESCNKELKLFARKTQFKNWPNGMPYVINSLEVANQGADFNKIVAQLDRSKFKKLKSTYGCPDCADGGAEWIAVKSGISSKKVTFEYGNPPEELKALNEQLRAIQQRYDRSK